MERRDLPGNDASWYRALLEDPAKTETLNPPVQQTLLPPAEEEAELEPPPALEEDETRTPEPEPELEADDADPEAAADDSPPAATPPDLVVQPPRMTGETEPVHFPEEPETESPVETTGERPHIVPPPDDDGPIDNTSEMVGQLWTAQDPDSPFDGWEPDDMDRTIKSSRPFRWTSVIAALAVIALIVVGLVLLPSITRSRADAHMEMMTSALWELRAELPDTQASLQVATEPTASTSALNDLSTQLTVLAAKASAVDAAGRAELPSAPPFTSSEPIDELVPVQQRLEPLATAAQNIQRRISNLVEYRSLMAGFMVLPELPIEADAATQADLRVALASAQAESASILADLPTDVSLSAHQDLARSINEQFATWQIDYLEALRTQDSVAAEALVTELEEQLVELDAALITPLAQIRRQTDTDLIDLARAIDEVIDLANGETPTAL
ncbi:MAG: hypothetical protein QNJ81_07590 [Acidimicrobiia bacterium]|nr:hypothetical protein [Acidimicrobiia bacterium]